MNYRRVLGVIWCVGVLSGGAAYSQTQSARIFMSVDGGNSWRASDKGFPRNGTVNDFASAGGVVVAGTEGNGVYLSKDGGQSWVQTTNGLPAKLKVNAAASVGGVFLVGSHEQGIFRSGDFGRSWVSLSDGPENTSIRRFAVDGTNVFAGTETGESWEHMTGRGQVTGVTILSNNIFYADVEGLLVSRDSGKNWRRVLQGVTPHNLADDRLAVFALLYGRGNLKSDDAGATWETAHEGLPIFEKYTFQIRLIDGVLFAAQWDGIYTSVDGGKTWIASSRGLPEGEAITDIYDVGKGRIIAGAGLVKR